MGENQVAALDVPLLVDDVFLQIVIYWMNISDLFLGHEDLTHP